MSILRCRSLWQSPVLYRASNLMFYGGRRSMVTKSEDEISRIHRDKKSKEEHDAGQFNVAMPGSDASKHEMDGIPRDVIEERVLKVVKNFPKIDSSKVSPTADFTSDLGLDSLDSVELVIALEDEFDVMIPDGDADKIGSCTAAIDYIDSLKIGTIV